MNKEEIIAREDMYSGKIFTASRLKIRQGEHESTRDVIYHNGGSCVIAIDEAGNTCLVRQFRIATGEFLYELPAGKLESGETEDCCATRELREESGWQSQQLSLLTRFYPTPGYSSEPISVFLARQITKGEPSPDEGEDLERLILPLEEAIQMIETGEIKDGKTIIGLLMAKTYLERN